MADRLEGRRIAILATDGFEQIELVEPLEVLREEGATVEIIAPQAGEIQGFEHFTPGLRCKVDHALNEVSSTDYDALVLPGGAHNPDALRIDERALEFVRGFAETGKPLGAICHAPWILINAGLVEGRTLTSYKSIRRDLTNAGARVVDQEVVVDGELITSRDPRDLPAFCARLVDAVEALGSHHGGRE